MPNLMEIVVRGTYFEQEIINRFNYLTSSTPASVSLSFALTSAFGGILDEGLPDAGTIIYQWGLQVVDSFAFADIFVRDVYSDIDFYETPMVFSGDLAEQGLSPAMAFGFKTNRTNLSVRRGQKRLCGVGEGASNSGGVLSTGALAACNTLAGLMSATLTYTDEGTPVSFNPVIVSKQKYDPETGLADPDGTAYRYYPVPADQFTHLATGVTWTPYTTVRTQGSRQYGRGR